MRSKAAVAACYAITTNQQQTYCTSQQCNRHMGHLMCMRVNIDMQFDMLSGLSA